MLNQSEPNLILTAHATKVNRPEPNWTEPQTCLVGRNHALSWWLLIRSAAASAWAAAAAAVTPGRFRITDQLISNNWLQMIKQLHSSSVTRLFAFCRSLVVLFCCQSQLSSQSRISVSLLVSAILCFFASSYCPKAVCFISQRFSYYFLLFLFLHF